MDELELAVKDARCEERVKIGLGKPPEEVRHDLWDVVCRRAGMDESAPVKDANVTGAEAAGMLDKPIHHDSMGA